MPRVLVLLLLLLTACAVQRPGPLPLPSATQREETLTLQTLLSEPQRWSGQPITLITPALLSESEQLLTSRPARTSQTARTSIWLADAPSDTVRDQLNNGAGYLKLRGGLSPPGAYGRDQRFTYQFVADEIDVLDPERTTIANLADNPRAMDGVLLAVSGTLLLRGDSALLVDRVSAGAVPNPKRDRSSCRGTRSTRMRWPGCNAPAMSAGGRCASPAGGRTAPWRRLQSSRNNGKFNAKAQRRKE